MPYVNPFTGATSDSCSVSAGFMADNAATLKPKGMSEAAFNKGQNLGAWGVHKGLLSSYDDGKLLFRAVYTGPGASAGNKYEVVKTSSKIGTTEFHGLSLKNLDTGEDGNLPIDNLEVLLQSDKWEWKLPGTPANTSVSPGSASPGSMSDVDVATMFVKVKDEIAKDKGINIKGANPQLDAQVYSSIGNQIGYTAAEVKAKVEAYKATGKKLSSLKKKTLGKAPTAQPIPQSQPVPSAALVNDTDLPGSPDLEYIAKVADQEKYYDALLKNSPNVFKDVLKAAEEKPGNFFPHQLEGILKVAAKDKNSPNPPARKTDVEYLTEAFQADVDAGLIDKEYLETKIEWGSVSQQQAAKAVLDKNFPEPNSAYLKKVAKYQKTLENQAEVAKAQGVPSISQYIVNNPKGYKTHEVDAAKNVLAKKDKTPEEILNDFPWAVDPAKADVDAVPLAVADDVVDASVTDALQALPEYTDEQVTKAYIKAKDQVAADTSNKFTLYTQGSEFDEAIIYVMQKQYDIDLDATQVKNQLARYTSEGNKVSVLKKKMAKTGEYVPQANTLKKSKGQAIVDGGPTTKTQAQAQVADLAGDHVPDGSAPVQFTAVQNQWVFGGTSNLKGTLYSGMQPAQVYAKVLAAAENFKTKFPNAGKPSPLDILRSYDKQKSAELGITNGNFYEKKVVEYLASPEGKANALQIQQKAIEDALSAADKAAAQAAKDKAEAEFIANLPPLPTDSKDYLEMSTSTARAMQDRLRAWDGRERPALREYTGGAYRTINRNLRAGGTPTSEDRARQAGMRAVDRPFLTHRGTGYSQFGVTSKDELFKLLGQVGEEKGFMSTSVGERAAFGGEVRMEVEWPTGSYGAYVDHISSHPGEREFLGAAGTKFTILSIKPEGYQTVVRVRVIPGSHRSM